MPAKILLCLLLCVFSTSSLAQDRSAIAREIQLLESRTEVIEQRIPELESTLEKLTQALQKSRVESQSKKEELDAQKALAEKDPSAANLRSLNLIENAYEIGQLSIATQERRIERQTAKLQEAQSELDNISSKIAANLAILAKPAPEPEPEPKPQPQPAPALAVTAPAIEPTAPAKPELPSPSTVAETNSESDKDQNTVTKASFSSEQLAEATEALIKINGRLAQRGSRSPFKFLILKLGRDTVTKLDFIGSDTFIGDIVLPAGDVFLEINGQKFRRTIPEKDANSTHTIVAHVKTASRFDVDVFSNELLKELDAKFPESAED